jgi:hypothetical protein
MSNIKLEYAASSALTITLASLATSATWVFGRESTEVNNTTNKYLDYLLAGKITLGTTPTAGELRVYVIGLAEDATYPDVFDGTDSDETWTTAAIRDSVGKLAAVIATPATSDQTQWFGPTSVAALFGGVLPKKFVVFVTHNTAVNLNATAGNHAIYITPVYETVV